VRLGNKTGPIPFQLKTSLTPGGTATAYLTEPDGTIIDESTPLVVTVTDTIGDKRAIGKDDRSAGGALGLAEVLADGTVAIVELQANALLIRGLATAAVEDDDPTFMIDNIEILVPSGGLVADQVHPTSTASTMTIYNRPALALDEDAEVVAEWNEATLHWEWRAPTDAAPSLLFYNASGEEVPARAVMAVVGGGAEGGEHYVSIEKPSATYRKQYVVNGAVAVAAAAWGRCYDVGHRRVLYDTGTPALGELWGPKASQWSLSKTMTARSDWGVIVAGIYDVGTTVLAGKITDQGMARVCTAILYENLATTDGDCEVDNVASIDGGWIPVASTADGVTLTVYNTRKFEGDNNGNCKIYYNVTTGHWEFDDIECPE
jgi:hypothetical protein